MQKYKEWKERVAQLLPFNIYLIKSLGFLDNTGSVTNILCFSLNLFILISAEEITLEFISRLVWKKQRIIM